jgi:hypothetical protein
METQIGISPALKARFEDIVVSYRDSQSNGNMDNSTQGTSRTGRHGVVVDPFKVKPRSHPKAKPELLSDDQNRRYLAKN